MKKSYEISVEIRLEGVKPEELAHITNVASEVYEYGYGPTISSISPEYEYDCDGYRDDLKGTYSVTFGSDVSGCGSLDNLKRHLERWHNEFKELENKLYE